MWGVPSKKKKGGEESGSVFFKPEDSIYVGASVIHFQWDLGDAETTAHCSVWQCSRAESVQSRIRDAVGTAAMPEDS